MKPVILPLSEGFNGGQVKTANFPGLRDCLSSDLLGNGEFPGISPLSLYPF